MELFANYLDLRKANSLNSENQQYLVENIASKAKNSIDISNKYFVTDLNLTETTDENLRIYAEMFADTYLSNIKKIDSILGPDDLEYIRKVGFGYINFSLEMLALPVPDVAGNVHTEIVNRIHNAGTLLLSFSENYEGDPLKSLFAIQKIQLNAQDDFSLYNSLAVYFRDNGIIFEESEVIRFWNYFEGQ